MFHALEHTERKSHCLWANELIFLLVYLLNSRLKKGKIFADPTI